MNDDDDGPPMLVSSENVDDADASLNAEMADAQIQKVPISIITGESISHSICDVVTATGTCLSVTAHNARLASKRTAFSATMQTLVA
jgi:hypothetical protein